MALSRTVCKTENMKVFSSVPPSACHIALTALAVFLVDSLLRYVLINRDGSLTEVMIREKLFLNLYIFMFAAFVMQGLYIWIFMRLAYIAHGWINDSEQCSKLRKRFPDFSSAVSELLRFLFSPFLLYLSLASLSLFTLISHRLVIEDISGKPLGQLLNGLIFTLPDFSGLLKLLVIILLLPIAIMMLRFFDKFRRSVL